jgi:hypothetical protein
MAVAPPSTARVIVQAGRSIYIGHNQHPFREGAAVTLPESHVAELEAAGHVKREPEQAPAPAAPEPAPVA